MKVPVNPQKLVLPILIAVCIFSVIANIFQAMNSRKSRPVVTVGDQKISVYDYESAQDQASGAAVLRKMVFTDLVRQAATKAGVMPTQKDVDLRISDLQARNPQVAAQAKDKDFRDGLLTDIALENIRIKDVVATDAEIQSFYNRNKAAFAIPSQVQTTMVVTENQSDADRATHLLQQDVKPETIAAQPGLHVAGVNGFNINMQSLPAAVGQQIQQTVLNMKPGQIKTIPVSAKLFLTFKVKSARATVIPALADIRALVTRQVKLQKAVTPQQELATLYQNNPPTFQVARYAKYFQDIQNYNDQKKTASAE